MALSELARLVVDQSKKPGNAGLFTLIFENLRTKGKRFYKDEDIEQ